MGGGVGVENTPQVGGGVGVLPRLSPKARFSSERSEAVKSSLLNLPLSCTTVVLQREGNYLSEIYCKELAATWQ